MGFRSVKIIQMYEATFQFVMLGDSSVGKSSIINQNVRGFYDTKLSSTIGVDFSSFIINGIKLYVWDTGGQERYKSIARSYYRNVIGCVLLYDVTNKKTFENVVNWIEDIKNINSDCFIILCGNKIDLESWVVSYQEGKKLAEDNNCLFVETTSTNQESAVVPFDLLTKHIKNYISNHSEFKEKIILKKFAFYNTTATTAAFNKYN